MYCQSCGNEIAVELKYCNRCGANLAFTNTNTQLVTLPPVKLAVPTIALALTIIAGLGIIMGGAAQMSVVGVPAVAIVWMVIFAVGMLFGCASLMIRFWTKLIDLQRHSISTEQPPRPSIVERPSFQQLPPRVEGVPSVTENTTRTFSPVYTEAADRGTKEYK
jgi:hypothetical protein